jgi:hypothetical protein
MPEQLIERRLENIERRLAKVEERMKEMLVQLGENDRLIDTLEETLLGRRQAHLSLIEGGRDDA